MKYEYKGKKLTGIDMESTGKRICQLIEESGLNDKELAEILGLSVQSVNKWRHGKNLPDTENLFMLSQLFGISIDEFFVATKLLWYVEMEFYADCEAFERRMLAYVKAFQKIA